MAKLPQPGRVKTRLMPSLSAEQASAVHAALLRHVAGRLSGDRLVICHDPPEASAAMRRALPDARFATLPQSAGDLGRRMSEARRALQPRGVVFLGVDSPDLPDPHLDAAEAELRRADLVVGPCDDGGFWCLGVAAGIETDAILADIAWSSGRECGQVRARAAEAGLRVADAPAWDDVDRADDLERLIDRIEASPDAALRRLHGDLCAVFTGVRA